MALKWLLNFPVPQPEASFKSTQKKKVVKEEHGHGGFQMPLHYPRYTKEDYEKMEEWKVDLLLKQYGLGFFKGTLEEKRAFAKGTFLWPDQLWMPSFCIILEWLCCERLSLMLCNVYSKSSTKKLDHESCTSEDDNSQFLDYHLVVKKWVQNSIPFCYFTNIYLMLILRKDANFVRTWNTFFWLTFRDLGTIYLMLLIEILQWK